MEFAFHRVEHLPRLAWCVRMTEGSATADVFHGPWVETRTDRFFEGAWAGDFDEGNFAEATVFCGTGAVLDREGGNGVLFCGPTHNWGRLHSVRHGLTLLVSNSLVFALEQSGESLDLGYARYFFDFLRFFRRGAAHPTMLLRTASGNPVELHQWTHLRAGADLQCHPHGQNLGPAPTCFADVHGALSGGVQGVVANAAAAGRRHRFQPLAMVSEGYDAPACAALAAQAGCREGITLHGPVWEDGTREDGSELGRLLGLNMERRDYQHFRQMPGITEAEFCAGVPFAPHIAWASFEDRLEGTLLITGSGGDRVWVIDKSLRISEGKSPPQPAIPVFALAEFRLRKGLLSFPVPLIQSRFRHEVYRISLSEEMRPWRLGTEYDRPVPRRIVEQAGVPRGAFARGKRWAAHRIMGKESMTEAGWRDFDAFYQQHVKPKYAGSLAKPGPLLLAASYAEGAIMRFIPQLPPPLYEALVPLTHQGYRDCRMPQWTSPFLYCFHWGVETIRSRYAIDRSRT